MQMVRMNLKPALISEFEAETAFAGRLGVGEEKTKADDAQVQEWFKEIDISLPRDIEQRFLSQYDTNQPTPLNQPLLPDNTKYDYYLMEVPVTTIVPGDRSLVWLGLALDMRSSGKQTPLPYSLFPTTEFKEKDWDIGELSLDTAKALSALLPGLDKIADALSFKVKFPLQWKSRHWTIQSTNRLQIPAKWIVKDEAILNGFNAYTVVRAPKGATVEVEAYLQAGIKKGRFFATAETLKADRLSYTLRRD